MKSSANGMVTRYEASDYPHKTWDEIVAGMNASNAARNPAPVFVAHCLICPEKPGFVSLEAAQDHDKANVVQHRKLMSKKEN